MCLEGQLLMYILCSRTESIYFKTVRVRLKKNQHIYTFPILASSLYMIQQLFSQQKNSFGKTTLIATKSDGRLKFILYLQGNKLPTTGNPVVQGHGNLLFLEEAMSWNLEKTQPKFSTMRTGIPIALVK